jgi:hypothetical protein
MSDEVTKEDVLAGVQCELESMRKMAADYAQQALQAMETATTFSQDPKRFPMALSKAFYLAGFSRACHIYSLPGSHTENVWTGRVHAYQRKSPPSSA